MINIKSLNRIEEADTANDIRRASDIASANANYDKVAGPHKGLLRIPRGVRWLLTPNRKVAEAAKDRSLALQAAKNRFTLAKQGAVPKGDLDAAKFEWAKATGPKLAQARAAHTLPAATGAKPGMSTGAKIGLGGLAAGATIAGILALQRRKNRLPEPESYNDEEE